MLEQITFIPERKLSLITPGPSIALISITDLGYGAVCDSQLWGAYLHLEFFDIEADDEEEGVFSYADAQSVRRFLDELSSQPITHLVIHCYAGRSRSAAVAKFAGQMFDISVADTPGYNRTVYERLRNPRPVVPALARVSHSLQPSPSVIDRLLALFTGK